jgi:hypothetical protein
MGHDRPSPDSRTTSCTVTLRVKASWEARAVIMADGFIALRAPPRACVSFIGLLYAVLAPMAPPFRPSTSNAKRTTNSHSHSHGHRVPESPTPSPLPVSAQLLRNSECVCAYGNRNRASLPHACVCAVSQAVQKSVSCSAPAFFLLCLGALCPARTHAKKEKNSRSATRHTYRSRLY